MILLVLLVSPTNRWREVGESETDTALDSRLQPQFSFKTSRGTRYFAS